ncbi:hypothetical protein [Rhodovulum marinum]|uniref:Uncharacterized protein n=1 Tax=Rhodovulum marinum TaxID=320662 RepID=A0A4R2Q397_9RHOB|nr:hypothetical protein [Rhodovulum marinum]TCP42889.1 hypothetical protein EV662_10280 [Rhodovulum marinum]
MLTTLKRDLGKQRIGHFDRSSLTDYDKMRAERRAGPVTLGIDIGSKGFTSKIAVLFLACRQPRPVLSMDTNSAAFRGL